MPEETPVWLNVKIDEPELVNGLDEMVAEDDSDRSKFIRKLIRQEIKRRQDLPDTGELPKKHSRGTAA